MHNYVYIYIHIHISIYEVGKESFVSFIYKAFMCCAGFRALLICVGFISYPPCTYFRTLFWKDIIKKLLVWAAFGLVRKDVVSFFWKLMSMFLAGMVFSSMVFSCLIPMS